MERLALVLILCVPLLGSCEQSSAEKLVGKWRLDSAYYHYNQFGFSSGGWHQEEVYEFLPSGETRTLAQHSAVVNEYKVEGRELIYLDTTGMKVNTYEILGLNSDHLILRAEKVPLFKGANQNRFEVRYFSRLD